MFCSNFFKTLLVAAVWAVSSASAAQTVLKWAHAYEASEPFHTQAVWAAQEIERRTNGRYHIDVYPASQLGSEISINQGLTLGTIDIKEPLKTPPPSVTIPPSHDSRSF